MRHVAPAFFKFLPDRFTGVALHSWADSHCQQRSNDREIAKAIDQEAISLASRRNNYASDRWPEKPGGIHHGRVERDGIAQISAVLDHLDHKSLPSRHIDRI